MRLSTIDINQRELAAIRTDHGYLPIATINRASSTTWPDDLFTLINSGRLPEMMDWYAQEGLSVAADLKASTVPFKEVQLCPLYRCPSKIWGIGLNYVAHASDLDEKAPTGIPGSFNKPPTTIIGPGDAIKIPYRA